MTVGLSVANAANPILAALLRGVPLDNDNVYMQLHTGDPGAAGTANVSAVTTRQQVTLATEAGGSIAINNVPAYLMSTTETITHISLWSALSGGSFLVSGALLAQRSVRGGDLLVFNQLTVALSPLAA